MPVLLHVAQFCEFLADARFLVRDRPIHGPGAGYVLRPKIVKTMQRPKNAISFPYKHPCFIAQAVLPSVSIQ